MMEQRKLPRTALGDECELGKVREHPAEASGIKPELSYSPVIQGIASDGSYAAGDNGLLHSAGTICPGSVTRAGSTTMPHSWLSNKLNQQRQQRREEKR